MDLALFFILPLIGGFAFATGFDLLRYRTGRQGSQRLYQPAAMIGVPLAVVDSALHFYDTVLTSVVQSDALGEVAARFQLLIPVDERPSAPMT